LFEWLAHHEFWNAIPPEKEKELIDRLSDIFHNDEWEFFPFNCQVVTKSMSCNSVVAQNWTRPEKAMYSCLRSIQTSPLQAYNVSSSQHTPLQVLSTETTMSKFIKSFRVFPMELFRVNNGRYVQLREWTGQEMLYDIHTKDGYVKAKALDPATYARKPAFIEICRFHSN
jgi:hypothetical protein